MLDSKNNNSVRPLIYCIDGDSQQKQSVQELADSLHADVQHRATVIEMLDNHDWSRPACVVTNLCQLALNASLRTSLEEDRCVYPVVVLGIHHARLAFEALARNGLQWLKKPYEQEKLREAVRKALEVDSNHHEKMLREREIRARIKTLTTDEKCVLQHLLAGKINKEIARSMDVSKRTIENRRSSILQKMVVESLAELVLLVAQVGTESIRTDQRHESEGAVPKPKLTRQNAGHTAIK